MKMVIDRSLLLIVGLICAALSWLFWSSLGQHAFDVIGTVLIVYLFAENNLLRRYIKQNIPPSN